MVMVVEPARRRAGSVVVVAIGRVPASSPNIVGRRRVVHLDLEVDAAPGGVAGIDEAIDSSFASITGAHVPGDQDVDALADVHAGLIVVQQLLENGADRGQRGSAALRTPGPAPRRVQPSE